MKQYAEEVRAKVDKAVIASVEIAEIDKMNEEGLIAISIGDGGIKANFYVNECYEDGMSADECAQRIIEAYEEVPEMPSLADMDFSFDSVKGRLSLRLFDMERNEKYSETVVHREVGCGLAIVPDIIVPNFGRAVVSNTIAEDFECDSNELIDIAIENSEKIAPAELTTLESKCFGGSRNLLETGIDEEEGPFVLTNTENTLGAAVMFYNGMLERVKSVIGCDFYILPCSIHELIIIPNEMKPIASDMKAMVKVANSTFLNPSDILSDDIFFYDGELQRIA